MLLRDPVERAVSAYLHHMAFGSVDPAVPLLEAPEILGLIEIGRYGLHLEAWLDRVGTARLCVLPAPGEVSPSEVLADAIRFLGGRPTEVPGVAAPVFEGTPRRRDEAGVWVPSDAPGLGGAAGPQVESGGRAWVRVVDAATLDALAAELAPDRARLRRQLARAGVEADWVERWIGPGRAVVR